MIVEALTYVLKNILSVMLICFILKTIIGYTVRIKKIALVLISGCVLALSVLPLFFVDDLFTALDLCDLASLIAFIAIPYTVFRIRKKLTFFWVGLIVNTTLDFASYLIDSTFKIRYVFMSNTVYSLLILILLAGLEIPRRIKHFSVPADFFEKIPSVIYVVILFSSLSSYYTMTLAEDPKSSKTVSHILLAISAVLVLISIIYLVSKYIRLSKLQSATETQLESQLNYYERIAAENKDIRRFRHDFEDNMTMLSTLINDGNIDEAKEYIAELNHRIEQTKITYSTGNRIADAIISDKATKSNASLRFEGTIPCVGISNNDLCTILANALQNAIRGCENINEAQIEISAIESPGGFILTITNPVEHKITIKNNKIQTTKKDKENHGLGLDNIRRVVEKYNGFLILDCDDHMFTFKVGMITSM